MHNYVTQILVIISKDIRIGAFCRISLVPMPPLQVSASPIDTKSIQMTLLYGYSVNLSQCTFYEIRYSNRTEYVAYAPTLVNQTLRSLESDSRYDINTFAQSNYSTTFPSISRNSTPTSAWTCEWIS